MNKLESTLKHNLDITMQNSLLIIGSLYKQFGSAISTEFLIEMNSVVKSLGKMREYLAEVDTFDKKPESNLHPLFQGMMDSYKETFGIKEAEDNFNAQAVSEDEWIDQEADVNGIKTR